MSERPIEVVERKGLGHPDTLCDSLAEAVSRALTRIYLERAGVVLHHDIDQALLVPGTTEPAFGGGRVLTPMRFVLGDAAVADHDGLTIPVDEVAGEAVRRFVRENLRFVEPEKHLAFQGALRQPARLSSLLARDRRANDTTVGAGWAPLTETERLVFEAEQWLNAPATKQRFPEAGEDVKVFGVRRGRVLELSVTVAFVDRFVGSEKRYLDRKEALRKDLLGHLSRGMRALDAIDAQLNLLEASNGGRPEGCLTVLGTSAESSTGGQVGRGNRIQGLTSYLRPDAANVVAGKNPRGHAGKIYNLLAHNCARLVHESVAGLDEVHVLLVSRVGAPFDRPWLATIELILSDGVDLGDVEVPVREVLGRQLAGADAFIERLIQTGAPVC